MLRSALMNWVVATSAPALATLLLGAANVAAQGDPFLDTGLLAAEIESLRWTSSADLDSFTGEWPSIFTRYVTDEVASNIREIQLLRGIALRTDQQLGNSSGVNGTTSLIEKAGLPVLLGLAVESGAVQQQQNGTSLVLSTTPYAAIALASGDTAENFRKYEYLSNFGISASFPLNDDARSISTGKSFKAVSQVSVKWLILGNRSPRTRDFTADWNSEFGPKIDEILKAETRAMDAILNGNPDLHALQRDNELRDSVRDRIVAQLDTWDSDSDQSLTAEDKRRVIVALIRSKLQEPVADGLTDGSLKLSREDREEIANKIGPAIAKANRALFGGEKSYSQGFMDLLKRKNPLILTVGYSARFVDGASDVSDLLALGEYSFKRLDLSFTGDVSFNNEPDSSIGQSAVRSFAFGAGLTWSTFLDILPSKGPITISAIGKVTRNEDSDHTIGNAQARLSVPIGAGLRLPIAVTYASRTNTSSKSEVIFNVGLTMDLEQITSWMQIGRLARAIGGRSAL